MSRVAETETRTRLSPMQLMTIERLRKGQEGKVPVTITAEARADALLTARARRTVTALVAFALIHTLMEHPALNAAIEGDELIRYADVNLGIAVSLPDDSLAVPVVHRAQELSLPELGAAIGDLAERARTKKLGLVDVHGGTFTLSSTGFVDLPIFGTPLLAPGQSGILLVGAAMNRPVVVEGLVEIVPMLPLSLTFDHAVVNGMPALRFLADLTARIEQMEAT